GGVESFGSGRHHSDGRGVHQSYRHSFDARVRDFDHATLPAAQERDELEPCTAMTTIYSASWVVPVSAAPIENGAVAVDGQRIAGVGPHAEIVSRFPDFRVESLGEAIILP